MLGKICFLILSIGVTASLLLMLRQQRLDAVHELAVIQERIAQEDQNVLPTLRTRIAAALTPDRIDRLAVTLGPMVAIGVEKPAAPDVPDTRVAGANGPGAKAGVVPVTGRRKSMVVLQDGVRVPPSPR